MQLDEYTLLKTIGKGAFGEVYLTSKEGTNHLFATKKVSKQKADSPTVKKYFINEISILRVLNHKNIIHFETIKHTIHNYYIITEFCNGGGLSDCLEKYKKKYGKPFSEQIVQYLMRQIVDALKYLHNKRIMHRDIKLDNILVNFENKEDKKNLNMLKTQIKIIDFGFATCLGKEDLTYSTLGSPINMDPILLKKLAARNSTEKSLGYDEKADIWSLGTVCYEMLIGKGVFNAENMKDLIKKVELGTYHIPTNLSKEVVSFLNGMLQYNAKNRLSAEELSRHHFLTKNIKDFKNIDLTKVSNRIDKKGLNINIKKNQSIWAIFKEEDEKALIDIPGKYLMETKPIMEQDEIKTKKDNNPFQKQNNENSNNNKNIKENNNKNIKESHKVNKKINININVNNKILQNPKEKEINNDLQKKQQQNLYYQLNLKNNNYQRTVNYVYNNPYNVGLNNNLNYNIYFPNGQPKYYVANLNQNVKNNPNTHIHPNKSPSNKNMMIYSPINNQIYPQYQYINCAVQSRYIIKDNEIIPNPAFTQQQQVINQKNYMSNPQPQLPNKNFKVINQINVPDNKKIFSNKANGSNVSNTPKGSRRPHLNYRYVDQTQKINILENQKQNLNLKFQNINTQTKMQEQNQINQKSNEKLENLKHKNSEKINQINPQQPLLQKKLSNYEDNSKYKTYNIDLNKNQIHSKSKERDKNEQNRHNKQKSHTDFFSNLEEPKNNSRHYIKKNTNENNYKNNNKEYDLKHKNSNQIEVAKTENQINNKITKDEDKCVFPIDDKNNNKNKIEKKTKTFTEPFPFPEDNYLSSDKKTSDELDNLIDFKLGDELCLEPESVIENKINDFNDEKEENNLDLPMKKIMDHTVERPTIGVPSPGTDPNDNYDDGDDFNNGVFQSSHKKLFDDDDFDEI